MNKTQNRFAKVLAGLRRGLRVLFTPSCWVQNHPYSRAWDRRLRELLDEHDFVLVDEFTARLGDYEIWIANQPYASMYPWRGPIGKVHVRAKRGTILEAHDKFWKDVFYPKNK